MMYFIQPSRSICTVFTIESIVKFLDSQLLYSVIKKDGLNFVRLYFLNYTWYVNDLHNI